jgi:hypothetical protein
MVNWGIDPSFRRIFHVVLDTSQQLLVSQQFRCISQAVKSIEVKTLW